MRCFELVVGITPACRDKIDALVLGGKFLDRKGGVV